jgi:metallo-beta-lactamase class B
VVADWDTTVEEVMKKYPEVKVVVPGHGDFGGKELLPDTIDLVKREKNKVKHSY